ncbi:MAG: ABC transporter substrate-binding protein [Desulfarculaceae bacterium]|jgi:branched-chain amino acid transport system substrate-binding protein
MRFQKTITVVGLLMLVFMATGNWPALAKEPYKIGVVVPITGVASFLGEPKRNTAQLIADRVNKGGGINGHPLELVIYDTESNATKTLLAVKKLIKRDEVLGIMGPSRSGNAMAVIPTVERFKAPLIAMAASRKIGAPVDKRKWVFKVVPGDDLAVRLIYGFMKKKGIRKVALMTVSSGYGISGREQLQKLASQYGIRVVADITYGPKESDLTAQLTKARGSGASAIINWSIGPTQILVTRNWKQLGIKIPLYQSYGFASKRNIELSGGAAEGVILPVARVCVANELDPKDPHYQVATQYKKLYETKFKSEVNLFGGHAWDAINQFVAALKAVGPDRAKIRDYQENLKNFVGINGTFNRSPQDHAGLSPDCYVMVQVKDGDWHLLK